MITIKRPAHLLSRRPCPSLLQTNATLVSPLPQSSSGWAIHWAVGLHHFSKRARRKSSPSSQAPMINRTDHLRSCQHCRPSLLQTNTTRVFPSSRDIPPLVSFTGTPLLSSSLFPLKTPTRKTRLNRPSGKFMTISAMGKNLFQNSQWFKWESFRWRACQEHPTVHGLGWGKSNGSLQGIRYANVTVTEHLNLFPGKAEHWEPESTARSVEKEWLSLVARRKSCLAVTK